VPLALIALDREEIPDLGSPHLEEYYVLRTKLFFYFKLNKIVPCIFIYGFRIMIIIY
jgi:hypothetical protein